MFWHRIKFVQLAVIISVALGIMVMVDTVFAAVAKASTAVEVTSKFPQGCQFIQDGIVVSGVGNADAPSGDFEKYHIQIDWGDGNTDDEAEESYFGKGRGESKRTFSGSHFYDSDGVYTITARIYHGSVPNNNEDADNTASGKVCVGDSDPDLGSIYGYIYRFEELAGDNQREPLAGWTVWLVHGENSESTVTDEKGMYRFYNLEADEEKPYVICEKLPDGWVQAYPYEVMDESELVECDTEGRGKWGYTFDIMDNAEYHGYDFGNVEVD